jgi:hypothetical protein
VTLSQKTGIFSYRPASHPDAHPFIARWAAEKKNGIIISLL